jgi:hypothetical protein
MTMNRIKIRRDFVIKGRSFKTGEIATDVAQGLAENLIARGLADEIDASGNLKPRMTKYPSPPKQRPE